MSEIGHIKIAITSNGLTRVDVAFILAKQILFYDVSYDTVEFLDSVRFGGGGRSEEASGETSADASSEASSTGKGGGSGDGPGKKNGDCWMDAAETGGGGGDRLTPRVDAVKGCHVIFTKGLSDLAAVKLHDNKVFPVKMEAGRDIDEVITLLQKMMNSPRPPLWLRKALGYGVRNDEYLLAKDPL